MASRLLLLGLLLSLTSGASWAQAPVGGEFQVNSYTTNDQYRPRVESDANGSFIVVWQSGGQDGGWGWGVFGQRFDAAGVPQGSEFQVNSYTTDLQYRPAVASDANGNFVVVWAQDASSDGVFGKRFNAAGVPQGSEFRVNSNTMGGSRPAVSSDASGNFVTVWLSYNQDGSNWGVFGQRFDAAGLPQGSEFQVNSYTTGSQYGPAVASDANGNFVTVWQSYNQDGSGWGVFGQRFDAAGLRQGSEFPVNSYTTGYQRRPAVAADANGNFVVVWLQDESSGGVFGKRFDAAGGPQGSEVRVNSYTTTSQNPGGASAVNGHFVVVWEGCCQCCQYGNWDIWGQRYDSDLIFKDGFQ